MNSKSNVFSRGLPRRLFAMVLAVCMVFTMTPPVTAAGVTDSGKTLLSGFAELPENIREQSVALGATLDELNLPDTLEAMVYTVSEDTQPPAEPEEPKDSGEKIPPVEDVPTIGTSDEDTAPPTEPENNDAATPPASDGAADEAMPPEETSQPEESTPPVTEQQPAADTPNEDEAQDEQTDVEPPADGTTVPFVDEPASKAEIIEENDVPLAEEAPLAASPSDAQDKDDTDAEAGKTVIISGITWESDPLYDSETEGTYTFTAVLPSGYTVGDGIALPEITVVVGQAEQSAVDKVIAMIDALPTMDEWTAMDDAAARAVMNEILAAKKAYDALTAEEKAQIDETRTAKLLELAEMAEQLAGIMPMADIASGIVGGCSWRIDADGTLIIFPTNGVSGTLNAINHDTAHPWNSQKAQVTAVKVESGVIANADSKYLFSGLTKCASIDLSGLDTSKVGNMYAMFAFCSSLTSLDVSNFNTENLTDLSVMFRDCSSLTDLDVSKFDTAKVTNMRSMFDGCSGLTSLDLSSFDTAKVTDMSYMFYGCTGLTSLDLSGFDFTKVTSMSSMFANCTVGLNTNVYKNAMSNTSTRIYLYDKHSKDDLTTTDLVGTETNIFYKPYDITKSATTNGSYTTSSRFNATDYQNYFTKTAPLYSSGAPAYDGAKDYAQSGETVTVTIAPDSGTTLESFTVTQGSTTISTTPAGDNKYTFTIPAGDVTITAKFKLPGYPVTINAKKDGVSWSGHGKTFTLKDGSNNPVPDLTKVSNGTYTVYEGSTNTGVTVTVKDAAVTAYVDYYGVLFFDGSNPTSIAPQNVLKDVGRVTKPTTDPTKTGYTFAGWKKSNGGGAV